MAKSPSHKFGQIIGNLLKEITLPILQKFCDARGLYLDKQGMRGVRGKVRKSLGMIDMEIPMTLTL